MRTREIETCYLCGAQGKTLYEALTDRLFGATGTWQLSQCVNNDCRLIWVNPQVVEEDIWMLYSQYCTHAPVPATDRERPTLLRRCLNKAAHPLGRGEQDVGAFVEWVRALLSCFGTRREGADADLMWVTEKAHGSLLDVGCGSGAFLRKMRDRGWQVAGVEPDPKAALVATAEYGVPVRCGSLHDAAFPSDAFDVVVMSHVLEHVTDPVELLKECRRVLKPGGKLVAATPNSDSLGHKRFGPNWRGLEPPRHLHIFNKRSLAILAEKAGFTQLEVSSPSRLVPFMWRASRTLERSDLPHGGPFYRALECPSVMHKIEYLASRFLCVGEEVLLVAKK